MIPAIPARSERPGVRGSRAGPIPPVSEKSVLCWCAPARGAGSAVSPPRRSVPFLGPRPRLDGRILAVPGAGHRVVRVGDDARHRLPGHDHAGVLAAGLVWLSRLQARLFADRARQQLALGHTREAIADLTEAGRLDPDNYVVNFTLARLTQTTEPHRAWQIYQRLLAVQPEHHDEIAQTASRALLLAGRWEELAGLARQELIRGAPGEGAWLQALTTAARVRQRPEWIGQAAAACPRGDARHTRLSGPGSSARREPWSVTSS